MAADYADAVVTGQVKCPVDHEDARGLECTKCHVPRCLSCVNASTAPALRDKEELIDFLALKMGPERNNFPFECTICWDGNGTPPSLGQQLLDASACLSTRQTFQQSWITDFGRQLRDMEGLVTDGTPLRRPKTAPDDVTQDDDGAEPRGAKDETVHEDDGSSVEVETPGATGGAEAPDVTDNGRQPDKTLDDVNPLHGDVLAPRGERFASVTDPAARRDDQETSASPDLPRPENDVPRQDTAVAPDRFLIPTATVAGENTGTRTPGAEALSLGTKVNDGIDDNGRNEAAIESHNAKSRTEATHGRHIEVASGRNEAAHRDGFMGGGSGTSTGTWVREEYMGKEGNGEHNKRRNPFRSASPPGKFTTEGGNHKTGSGQQPGAKLKSINEPKDEGNSVTVEIQRMLREHREQIKELADVVRAKDMEIQSLRNRQQVNPFSTQPSYLTQPSYPYNPAPQPHKSIKDDEEFLLNLVRTVSQSHVSTASNQSQATIKAVPIELPKFDGDYLEYNAFIKHLDYHVQRQSNLSEVEKFAILRAHLEGPAADKIVAIDGISNNAYKVARDLLHETYGDRYAARDAAIQEFYGYKGTQSYTGPEMEAATDRLRLTVTKCREAGIPEDFLSISVGEVQRKLPAKVREDLLDLQDESPTGAPISIDEVLQVLRKHARRATRNERYQPRKDKTEFTFNQNSGPVKEMVEKKQVSGNTRPSFNQGQPQRQYQGRYYRDFSTHPCFYCSGRHTEFQCREPQEKKKQIVKDKKACQNCLGLDHKLEECTSKAKCRFLKCQEKHHTTLCKFIGQNAPKTTETTTLAVNGAQCRAMQAYFQTEASNPIKDIKCQVVALVDQGSTDSFILEETAKRLCLPTLGYRMLKSATCFTEDRRSIQARRVELDLKTCNGSDFRIEALAVQTLVPSLTIQPMKLPERAEEFIRRTSNVANAPPNAPTKTQFQVLLGNAIYGRIMRPATGCQALDENQDLVAYDTPFGAILSGTVMTSQKNEHVEVFFQKSELLTKENPDPLIKEIQEGWKLENIGISLRETKPDRDRTQATRELIENAKRDEDGRWEIRLPFKKGHQGIHHNWGKALGRLQSITKKLDKEQRETYFKTWSDLIEAGFLEPVPRITQPGAIVHYLPHFAVIKESSLTTKIRPVLDAAADTVEGGCLNDLLLMGPQTGEALIDILIRFRVGRYAVVSDVAKAFYAVGIAKEDRDAVRVLLPKDPHKPIEGENVVAWRYRRLVMGATCSSWILNSLLNETLQLKMDDENYTELSNDQLKRVKVSFYADNAVYTVETVDEGRKMVTEAQRIFDEYKMHLREYCSTLPDILQDLAEKDVHQLDVIKVLGMNWRPILDKIFLHENKAYDNESPTRRQLISLTASVYDPYGLFTPVTVRCRMLEREAVQDGTKWDEEIGPELLSTWKPLQQDLKALHEWQLNRNVRVDANEPLRLVAFSDASTKAFGAVVYAWQWVGQSAQCNLLISRAKLTPKDHKATVPRMELLSTHCAVLLTAKVINALQGQKIESVTVFSDSQITLHWIHSKKRLPPYETSRVNNIQESGITDFRHVGTKENPADYPSRGIPEKEMDDRWFKGPEFLTKQFHEWPKPWVSLPTDDETFAMLQLNDDDGLPPSPREKPFGIKLEKHKSYNSLLRVTGYARRFAFREGNWNSRVLTQTELEKAEKEWIKYAQDGYWELKRRLKNNEKPCKEMRKLRLYLDEEEIIRSQGRDEWPELLGGSEGLILLPKRSEVTRLIIMDQHNATTHSYDRSVLHELLQKYWITGGIRTIGSYVRKNCPRCRLSKGKALTKPEPGSLPKCRLTRDLPPFATTGMDFLGPIKVLNDSGGTSKRWVLLLTCGTTRAVHLELVNATSAQSTILGLERFYARCGISQGTLYLDNARGNVMAMGLQQELEEMLTNPQFPAKVDLHFAAISKKIEFIPVRAPWFGGFYERMVGAVKASLRPAIWKTQLEPEKMYTLLCRIEATLNARPLTTPRTCPDEPQALTPGHFLHPLGQSQFPMTNQDNAAVGNTKASEQLKKIRGRIDELLRVFWEKWQSEYLMELRCRHREKVKESNGTLDESPKEGEVYLLVEPSPRDTWKLARVLENFPDRRGIVRSCKVMLPSRATSTRSVTHLVPLEMSDD